MTKYTQYFVEIITRDGGYNYHKAAEQWYATVRTRQEADDIAQHAEGLPNVVATYVHGWRSDDKKATVKHGHHSTRTCALGANTTLLQSRLCDHQVSAKGGAPMALHKGAWRDATDTEIKAACGLKA